MGKPSPRNKKNISAFYVNVSSWFSSSWTSFHKYHPASWIIVIIHMEKTFRAMNGEMCGKHFRKILKITKHIKKQHECFLIPKQRYKHFRYFLQREKVYLIGQFPSSPTYSIKNLRSTDLMCHMSCGIYYIYCIPFRVIYSFLEK